ncbi:unnamed protein product [Polarella glacialis]|uniref:Pentatricopeptide repeat-containing protein, chloroplastic n=1 Tax=Polarella glacialis TaxID=89957 RepID=A0A813ICT4_POLGL|nr:unnamed protein product [Polarella glacialis]
MQSTARPASKTQPVVAAGRNFQGSPNPTLELLLILAQRGCPEDDEVSGALRSELGAWKAAPKLATRVLAGLVKNQLPRIAVQVLRAMRSFGVEVNVIHQNAVVSAFAKTGLWQLALRHLEEMVGMRVLPDVVSYNAAMSACEKFAQWQMAMSTLDKMLAAGVAPDIISYNSLISSCAKGGQLQLALCFLELIPQMRLSPTEISFGAAISSCETTGSWDISLHLLGSMRDRSIQPDVACYNSAMSSGAKSGRWQLAHNLLCVMQATRSRPDEISCNVAISSCEKGSNWQLALQLLNNMRETRATPDVISHSALISACDKGIQWQLALAVLRGMPQAGVLPNSISFNAAISACEKAGQWQLALSVLYGMYEMKVAPNTRSVNAAISACTKGDRWEASLELLSIMPAMSTKPDEISYNGALIACEKAGQWQLVLSLLGRMLEERLSPDGISFRAAIGACEAAGRLEQGLQLLEERKRSSCSESLSTLPWALAKLSVSDPQVVDAAFAEALSQLQASTHSPQELAALAWASAMIGVRNSEFSSLLASQAIPQIQEFKVAELMLVAWGAAAAGLDKDLSLVLQNEVASRLEEFHVRDCPESVRNNFVEATLGVVWACNFACDLSDRLQEAARKTMKETGAALDALCPRSSGQVAHPCEDYEAIAKVDLSSCEPQIVLDMSDRLVVLKPPNWEVGDSSSSGLQLPLFLQASLGTQFAILQDAEYGHGFLHRLDVPTSGLILAAKTYEAYFDLQVQLRAGGIARDYVVLCHGWAAPALTQIIAPVRWKGNAPTLSGSHGRPSRTELKTTAHASHEANAFSLVVIRIGTGRRHQIRSHFAHVGHPMVRDGKYTATATFESDAGLCERTCLHRYRLAFEDASSKLREVVVPLPEDLASAFQKLAARSADSAGSIHCWLDGHGHQDWKAYSPLAR